MKYGNNYVLKYVSKENDKLVFDIVEENGFNRVLDGTMQDLKRILKFSNDLTPEDDIKTNPRFNYSKSNHIYSKEKTFEKYG